VARHCIPRIAGELLAVHDGSVGFASPAVFAGISVQLEKRRIESAAAGSGSKIAQVFEFSHFKTPSWIFTIVLRSP
jgi:hypothetical protein